MQFEIYFLSNSVNANIRQGNPNLMSQMFPKDRNVPEDGMINKKQVGITI